jgi:hypothetical protein
MQQSTIPTASDFDILLFASFYTNNYKSSVPEKNISTELSAN